MENIEIKTKIKTSDLFSYMIDYNYKCIRGIIVILFSLACFAGVIIYWKEFEISRRLLLLFIGMVFVVFAPIEYYIRSMRQCKKNFNSEYNYIFNNDGIDISVEDKNTVLEWNRIFKVKSTRDQIFLYTSNVNAIILPKRDIGDKFLALKEMIEKNTDCFYCKIK